MDPTTLGFVMEEIHTGTEIPWDEEMGLEDAPNISLAAVESLLCRICAQQSDELVPVFDEHGIELNLESKIRWHLPIKVTKNDKLPVKVCPSCINRLDACHELVNICLDAEAELRDMFDIEDNADLEELNCDNSVTIIKLSNETEEDSQKLTPNLKRKRPFPSHQLMEAMQLLRKEKYNLKGTSSLSGSNQIGADINSEEDFEAIYLDEQASNDAEDSRVLDVEIEAIGDDLPAGLWNKANLRVKLPKDFADCNTTLKSRIVGAIQDIMAEQDNVEQTIIKNEENDAVSEAKEWTCEICGHEAPRKSSLMVHQRRNHDPSNFACRSCRKTFNNGIAQRTHERTHIQKDSSANWMDEDRPTFVCEYCGKAFRRYKALREHNLALHSDTKPYQCDMCDRHYGSVASLEIHKSTHSSETPFLCDLCGKGFKHVVNLRSHKRSHLVDEQKNRQVCNTCGKGFRSSFHLNEHMNVHKDFKPYTCEVCGKRFNKKIQLRQHSFTHSGIQPFKCHVCGIRFNRRGNMTQHLKRHEHQRKYTCRVCNTSFDTLGSVLQHRKLHSQEEMEKALYQQSSSADDLEKVAFKCDKCGKLLAKKESLAIHMRSHTGEKLFPCEFCGKRLSNKNSLTYHMRSYHTGERPFSCQFCTKTFLTREATLVHERIHTGDKPYICSVCMMGFRCSSNLAQHVRVHSGTRPFTCPHCDKCFLRKGALTVHMRTHTGERPFVCDQCGRGFTQKNDMLKHRRTHNSERPYSCQICGETFSQKRDVAKHHQLHMPPEQSAAEAIIITSDGEQQIVQAYMGEGLDQQTLVLRSF